MNLQKHLDEFIKVFMFFWLFFMLKNWLIYVFISSEKKRKRTLNKRKK